MQRISHFLRLKSRPLPTFLWMTSRLCCARREGEWSSDIRFDRGVVNRKTSNRFSLSRQLIYPVQTPTIWILLPSQFPFPGQRMAV
jgi:hypothetical protein